MVKKSYECCILGAGPAGLGTALELVNNGITDLVIIDRNSIVGGLSRTETFDGSKFDVGPHRYFTKNSEINKLWHDTLGDDFITVDRTTRILYNKKLFNYPISAFDTLFKLGISESSLALFSYLMAIGGPRKEIVTFEDWISNKFGNKLYETFFKTYTEKVWGIPCDQIGKAFAEQRIKGLDIIQVLKNAIIGNSTTKTLVDQFNYPILGAGQMYEAWADKVTAMGGTILLNSKVVGINEKNKSIENVEIEIENGEKVLIEAKQFFSSIPITSFFGMLSPQTSEQLDIAVSSLFYREHITVNLTIHQSGLFPDQWIYIHDPDVKMARLANYNNFSKAMAPGKDKTAISVEYFVFQDDEIWKMKNTEIIELAIDEMSSTGLIDKNTVEQGHVVRETESYPTYFLGYKKPFNILKDELNQYQNLFPIGRGGMYKYNNQDHSIYSGILAARNYLQIDGSPFNLWKVNVDAEYHEGAETINE
jgi:protoporphyrinogen oxidase